MPVPQGGELLRLVTGAIMKNSGLGIWFEIERGHAVEALATAFSPHPNGHMWMDATGRRTIPFNTLSEDDCLTILTDAMVREKVAFEVFAIALGRVSFRGIES